MNKKKKETKQQQEKEVQTFNLGNILFVQGYDLRVLIDDNQFNTVEEIDQIAAGVYQQIRTKLLEALAYKFSSQNEGKEKESAEKEAADANASADN